MNNNYTKVDIQELEALIKKLDKISNSVNSNINSYQKSLDKIEKAGYLKGVAELAINNSCSRIAKICSEYDQYAKKLVRELNQVITKTKEIETSGKAKFDQIISADPITFNGGGSGNGGFKVNTANLTPTLAAALKTIQGVGGTVGVAGGVAATAALNAAAKTGTTVGSNVAAGAVKAGETAATTAANATSKPATAGSVASNAAQAGKTAATTAANTSTATKSSTTAKASSGTSGKAMDIPNGSTSYKSYTNYKKVASNTPQGAVVYGGKASPYGKYAGTTYNTQTDPTTGVRYVTFEGDDTKYYCAAMGTYYGEVGDTFSVTTDTGNSYNVIMCDAKGGDAQGTHNGGTWYHANGSGNKCLTEFYIDYPADDIKVYGSGGKYLGTTGSYNDCAQFNGNITSITKLS